LVDHRGTLRQIATGQRDKKTAAAIGRNLERLVRCRVSGEPLDPVTAKWLESVSPKLRATLEKFGLLDAARMAALRPLVEHIDGADDAPGWRQYLVSKGVTPLHSDRYPKSVRLAFEGSGAVYWSDISATRIMAWLNDQRADDFNAKGNRMRRGFGAATFNRYVTALKSFGKWMQREGRASDCPLEGLRKLNAKTDKRHPRRPLEVNELLWLLDTTRNGPDRAGMTGPERAMLYRLATETGLRSNELRSLTRSSFRLDAAIPTVTVQAAYSKRRRDDVLPLRPDTANDLRNFLNNRPPIATNAPTTNQPSGVSATNAPTTNQPSGVSATNTPTANQPSDASTSNAPTANKTPGTSALNVPPGTSTPNTPTTRAPNTLTTKIFNMPPWHSVAKKLLRPDLDDARNAWINDATTPQEREQRKLTSTICYVDAQGRYADFHALRHTTGTLLALGGVNPKTAQTLMRHSDIDLTMSLYTHTLAGQEAAAIAALPNFTIDPMRQKSTPTNNTTNTIDATANTLAAGTTNTPATNTTDATTDTTVTDTTNPTATDKNNAPATTTTDAPATAPNDAAPATNDAPASSDKAPATTETDAAPVRIDGQNSSENFPNNQPENSPANSPDTCPTYGACQGESAQSNILKENSKTDENIMKVEHFPVESGPATLGAGPQQKRVEKRFQWLAVLRCRIIRQRKTASR